MANHATITIITKHHPHHSHRGDNPLVSHSALLHEQQQQQSPNARARPPPAGGRARRPALLGVGAVCVALAPAASVAAARVSSEDGVLQAQAAPVGEGADAVAARVESLILERVATLKSHFGHLDLKALPTLSASAQAAAIKEHAESGSHLTVPRCNVTSASDAEELVQAMRWLNETGLDSDHVSALVEWARPVLARWMRAYMPNASPDTCELSEVRRIMFAVHLYWVHNHNTNPPPGAGAVMALNQFGASTLGDKARLNTLRIPKKGPAAPSSQLAMRSSSSTTTTTAANPVTIYPSTWDWRSQTPQVVGPVENQQSCGSCYSFSGTETLASRLVTTGKGPLTVLSTQDIISCDSPPQFGCSGGYYTDVWSYADSSPLPAWSLYPYAQATASGSSNGDVRRVAPGRRRGHDLGHVRFRGSDRVWLPFGRVHDSAEHFRGRVVPRVLILLERRAHRGRCLGVHDTGPCRANGRIWHQQLHWARLLYREELVGHNVWTGGIRVHFACSDKLFGHGGVHGLQQQRGVPQRRRTVECVPGSRGAHFQRVGTVPSAAVLL